MSNRLDNTRVVTFEKDYFIKGRKEPLYSKGKEYAIHHATLEHIKVRGAKFDAKPFDEKGAVAKAKKQFEANKKVK
jgi:hypothetical protein